MYRWDRLDSTDNFEDISYSCHVWIMLHASFASLASEYIPCKGIVVIGEGIPWKLCRQQELNAKDSFLKDAETLQTEDRGDGG